MPVRTHIIIEIHLLLMYFIHIFYRLVLLIELLEVESPAKKHTNI